MAREKLDVDDAGHAILLVESLEEQRAITLEAAIEQHAFLGRIGRVRRRAVLKGKASRREDLVEFAIAPFDGDRVGDHRAVMVVALERGARILAIEEIHSE